MSYFRHLLCLLLGAFGLCLIGRAEVTVLALGDSITEGGDHFVCYRQYLPALLEEAGGRTYRFIGPKQDNYSAHAGYSGKNTAYLASIIDGVYRDYPADLVLLHSGHNSFSRDKPVTGILQSTEQMIEAILNINPNATILIAQVIPAGKLPKYDYIPALNEGLAELVQSSPHKRHLILVDQAEGFYWESDTVSDKVHPNEAGARKMAAQWAQAIRGLALP